MEFGDSRVRVSVFQVSSGLFSPPVSSAFMMWAGAAAAPYPSPQPSSRPAFTQPEPHDTGECCPPEFA
jgi:hypothetical protein